MGVLGERRVLVVGASSGIGREVALALADRGAHVAVAARRVEALADVAALTGGPLVGLDVRDPQRCVVAVDEAVGALGGLDALVYASGMSPLARFRDVGAEEWDEVLATNVVGAALVTRAALSYLPERGLAAFLSSDSTRRPRTGLVAYSTSKAALETLVVGLRVEHPEQRFLTVTVGPTVGTGFASSFDVGLLTELLGEWLREGHMTATQMDPVELGAVIADLVGTALAHPSVDLREVLVQPRGGMLRAASDPGPS